MSTTSVCNNTGFSQTACGFVVEFVDLIGSRVMNSTGNNIGGWPSSNMYTYLNGSFESGAWNRTGSVYSNLPSDLQNVIADTFTVSGFGINSNQLIEIMSQLINCIY